MKLLTDVSFPGFGERNERSRLDCSETNGRTPKGQLPAEPPLSGGYDPLVDAQAAASRWAAVWERAWPAKDVEAIAGMYADEALYRALAFREPDRGVDGVRDYLRRNFAIEDEIQCRFGE